MFWVGTKSHTDQSVVLERAFDTHESAQAFVDQHKIFTWVIVETDLDPDTWEKTTNFGRK